MKMTYLDSAGENMEKQLLKVTSFPTLGKPLRLKHSLHFKMQYHSSAFMTKNQFCYEVDGALSP